MTSSTKDSHGKVATTNGNGESGSLKTVIALIVWGVVTAGAMGFAWLSIQDRMNGIDAWREKAVRDQRDGYRKVCEENYDKYERLKEFLKQKKVDAPPDYLIEKTCVQPDAEILNKPKE